MLLSPRVNHPSLTDMYENSQLKYTNSTWEDSKGSNSPGNLLITRQMHHPINIVVPATKKMIQKKFPITLAISSVLVGSFFTLMLSSLLGVIDIAWEFFAALLFSTLGLSLSSLLILLGVDRDAYDI